MTENYKAARAKDIYDSMRPVVFWMFVTLWLGPLVWFMCSTDEKEKGFYLLVLAQTTWLVFACLAVALSRQIHQMVFRAGVPNTQFRRPLLVGAAYFGFSIPVIYVLWKM